MRTSTGAGIGGGLVQRLAAWADELVCGDTGERSASVTVSYEHAVHFRYLARDGVWFDEPEADAVTAMGSLLYGIPHPRDRHGIDAGRSAAGARLTAHYRACGAQAQSVQLDRSLAGCRWSKTPAGDDRSGEELALDL